ncbi:MAG: MmcQ/YjbR family DNA-binding protein [Synergistaceae bacterium]|nr:MmcQ/YjbR family DNA-binding protein [Synergistaceae bacterium]
MERKELLRYVKDKYGTEPDYPWMKWPSYAVLRHRPGRKWYGVLMLLDRKKLGLDGEALIDVINLKAPPELIDSLGAQEGLFPAYHMNREHWVTVALESGFAEKNLFRLLDLSYRLTGRR